MLFFYAFQLAFDDLTCAFGFVAIEINPISGDMGAVGIDTEMPHVELEVGPTRGEQTKED